MNKDQVKGKAKEIAGRVEKQAGYWTDDKAVEIKGAVLQIEGRAQKSWGDLKAAIAESEAAIDLKRIPVSARAKKRKNNAA